MEERGVVQWMPHGCYKEQYEIRNIYAVLADCEGVFFYVLVSEQANSTISSDKLPRVERWQQEDMYRRTIRSIDLDDCLAVEERNPGSPRYFEEEKMGREFWEHQVW